MSAKEHYDNHLANFYSWMAGDFDEKMNSFKLFCIRNGIMPVASNVAVDLGAGTGIQSVALAVLGFEVIAIDFSKQLLDELEMNGKGLNIQIVNEDIRTSSYVDKNAELIICAGDTLTHLNSIEEVKQLLVNIYNALKSNGKIVISFRDYSIELKDTVRFIPVKSDSDRILTCFLEYSSDKVRVTDILYECVENEWQQKISSYEKVRISRDDFLKMLTICGFTIDSMEIEKGMISFVGGKH